jgi:hypothetical protein
MVTPGLRGCCLGLPYSYSKSVSFRSRKSGADGRIAVVSMPTPTPAMILPAHNAATLGAVACMIAPMITMMDPSWQ